MLLTGCPNTTSEECIFSHAEIVHPGLVGCFQHPGSSVNCKGTQQQMSQL